MFGKTQGCVAIVIVALLWLSLCGRAGAEPVSAERARRAAAGFLRTKPPLAARGRPALSAAAASPGPNAVQAVTSDDGVVLAYVAPLESGGFIVTSADTNVTPVVAYSLRSRFDPTADRSSPLYALLTQDMRLRALAARSAGAGNDAAWAFYESSPAATSAVQQWPAAGLTTTGGWMETTWHQLAPYDALCPLDPMDGQRSVVGCAATAPAQLLNYHRRGAATFSAADAYTTTNGIDVDADSTRYGFPSFTQLNELLAALQLKYDQKIPRDDADAAVLSVACGFACKMDYSSAGSGAMPADVAAGLRNKFHMFSADLTGGLSGQTIHVVQENIINGLPVLLGIRTADALSGHLIVCDGYNTSGEYHLNFGWKSSSPAPIAEAWYRLPSGIPTSLNAIAEAIVNIQPVPPALSVDPTWLDFAQAAGQPDATKTFEIHSTSGPVPISAITCPPGFVAAVGDSNDYSDHVGAFELQDPNQATTIRVRFQPATPGGYYGTLAIHYGEGKVRYVVLQGDAHVGGTDVPGGTVSGTWSPAGSPYCVLGDITVAAGGQLTIEPGVQVIFMGHYSLTVGPDARLVAQGTAAQPIRFTAGNTQLGFGGLRLVGSAEDDVLDYCTITYASKGVGPVGTEYGDEDLSGGALYLYESSPTIAHCILANNIGAAGGAIFCHSSSPVIRNTLIANNACMGGTAQAGGIYSMGNSSVLIDNCTIVNNSPAGIYSEAVLDMDVTNTIVWGNRDSQILMYDSVIAASYCDVQGGFDGLGNIDADPAFVAPTGGIGPDYDGAAANWGLKSTSPCINAGGANVGADSDLVGNPRVYSDVIDIGACENQSDLALLTVTPAGPIDMGCVRVNTSQSSGIDVTNTGKRSLTVTEIGVEGATDVFAIVTPVSNRVLAPGASMHVDIAFTPKWEKALGATLHIYSTADNVGIRQISRGGGEAGGRQIGVRGVGIAGTVVSGPVSGSWTQANSPYTVTGNLSIPRNRTLTIGAGTVIRFAGPFSFTVGYGATLKANGTASAPITFTATNPNEGWLGLRFLSSGADDVLSYCTLQYAQKPYVQTSDWMNAFGGAILCCMDASLGSPVASSPTIDHCTISGCFSRYGGAICFADWSEAVLSNSTVVGNTALWYGGGVYCYGAYPRIANNIIAMNTACAGGGLYNDTASPTITSNTIVHNLGAGLYLSSTTYSYDGIRSTLSNNIVWENEIYKDSVVKTGEYRVRYNDIQGGWEGTGNIDADPLFADSAHMDYHLKSQAGRWNPATGTWVLDRGTSPCIDAGDPATPVGSEPVPNGGRIDMGAYGGTAQASKSP